MPERIQLRRTKGWRMPLNTVKVDRTTPWGNPFRIDEPTEQRLLKSWGWKLKGTEFQEPCHTSVEAVERFRDCVRFNEPSHYAVRKQLSGKNLACWCKPGAPCHADVLLEIANG